MTDFRDWYMGLAPATDAERKQAEVEAMYRRQDEANRRFDEAPIVGPEDLTETALKGGDA